jgi:hypothetical protein
MKQWLIEFKQSWRYKTFICSITIFILSYLLLASLALLVSRELYMLIISAIAGWQVASWSYRLAPKVKQWLFKD